MSHCDDLWWPRSRRHKARLRLATSLQSHNTKTFTTMSRSFVDLPVGTHPGWELEEDPSVEEKVPLHSVFERSVMSPQTFTQAYIQP